MVVDSLPHWLRQFARFTGRWLRRLLKTVITVLLAVLVALFLLQLTPMGRSFVLETALSQVNRLIPGTVEARELDRLSLLGIELHGVEVFDPSGELVATLEHAELDTDVSGLLSGTLAADQLALSDGWLDFRGTDENRGVLAAFVDLDAPEPPPSEGPPPDIRIHAIIVDEIELRLPEASKIGQVNAHIARIRGDYALVEGQSEAHLEDLSLSASRNETRVLNLHAQGALERGSKPSSIQLQAESLNMTLDLDAQGVLPFQEEWDDQPLFGTLKAEGITAQRLHELLRIEALKGAFLGTMNTHLEVSGKPSDLRVDGAVETAGGRLVIERVRAEDETIEARLSTEGLQLQKLKTGLPPRAVSGEISAKTHGFPPDPVRFSVQMRQARLDTERLADVDLSGRLTTKGIEDAQLEARSGESSLTAQGSMIFDGTVKADATFDARPRLIERVGNLFDMETSGRLEGTLRGARQPNGHLEAKGQLNVRDFQLDERTVDRANVRFDVRGAPPDLSGRVEVQASQADLGEAVLDSLDVSAAGTLEDFDVRLQASGGRAPAPEDGRPAAGTSQIDFEGRVQRGQGVTQVEGRGQGKLAGKDLRIDVKDTRVSKEGAVKTEGVRIEVGDQELNVRGGFGKPGDLEFDDLRIESQDVPLQQIASLLGYDDLQVTGTADIEGWLSGRPDLPKVRLVVTAKGAGLRDKPPVAVDADVQFDAAQGRFDVAAEISGDQVDVSFHGKGQFDGGQGYTQRLPQAKGQVRVDVERVRSEFLAAYAPQLNLPVKGELRAHWEASGSLKDPAAEATTEVFVEREGKGPVRFVHVLEYEAGRLSTELDVVEDGETWGELEAEVEIPEAPTAMAFPTALKEALREGSWQLRVETSPRLLEDVPLYTELTGETEAPPFSSELHLKASRKPGEEPRIDLLVGLRQARSFSLGGCSGSGLWVKAHARHRGSQNRLRVEGLLREKTVLVLEAQAEQALNPILAGNVTDPARVDVEMKTAELPLGEVPFVCESVRGTASLEARGTDVLGNEPRLQIAGKVDDFSLGNRRTVDLALDVQADEDQARAELQVQGKEQFSSSSAQLQALLDWSWKGGAIRVEEHDRLDAELLLSHLPIGPLLPEKGPISYPSGMIDGRVRAEGPLRAPEIHGEIRLEDTSFTITSLAQPLREVHGRIALDGRRLSVEHFEAHDRDGVLRLKGYLDLSDMKDLHSELKVEADDFPVRQSGQVVAVTDLEARAKVRVTPQATRAHVDVSKVDTWIENLDIPKGIDLDRHPEFVIDGDETALLKKALANDERTPGIGIQETLDDQREGQSAPVYIYVKADDHFWVKRSDFAVKLRTKLETEIRDESVRVDGDVRIERGYLQLFGKVFDLEKDSELRFIGSSPPNPVLEIAARHDTRGGKRVGVIISGRAQSPELTFLVEEEPVDASVAFRELFSGRDRGTEQDASDQAASFASGLTAGILATAARRELGSAAPIIMIDPGEKAGQGSVRAGFELDRIVPEFLESVITGVYLEGIVNRESVGADAEADTDFGTLLEFYFPKNFFAAGQYGPGTMWSVDFGWQL